MILLDLPLLLGDAMGVVPAIIELSKKTLVYILINPEFNGPLQIYSMIPKKYNVKVITDSNELPRNEESIKFDLSNSFRIAVNKQLHMTQAAYEVLGLPVPPNPIKPELELPKIKVPQYDYILAPFSRSLPDSQLWQQEKWGDLARQFKNKKFALFGNSNYDDQNFITEPNVDKVFDRPLGEAMNILTQAKGCVTVVTGISHWAFALDVKNVLLSSQSMRWGNNPDALRINKDIHSITVSEVVERINQL